MKKTNYEILIMPIILNVLIHLLSAFVFGTFDVREWNIVFKAFVAFISFIVTFPFIAAYFQSK